MNSMECRGADKEEMADRDQAVADKEIAADSMDCINCRIFLRCYIDTSMVPPI